MPNRKNKPRFVRSKYDEIGVYVWEMPDGRYVADEDGNFLSINAKFGDLDRMSKIGMAARQCGINEGRPAFLPGHRKISDAEYERQKERMDEGLIPDELDVAAFEEEAAARKTLNG